MICNVYYGRRSSRSRFQYNMIYIQNGTENEELAKVVARREEKWKENVETEQKEKREGTA